MEHADDILKWGQIVSLFLIVPGWYIYRLAATAKGIANRSLREQKQIQDDLDSKCAQTKKDFDHEIQMERLKSQKELADFRAYVSGKYFNKEEIEKLIDTYFKPVEVSLANIEKQIDEMRKNA